MMYRKLLIATAISAALSLPVYAGDYNDADDEVQIGLHTEVKTILMDAETLDARDINIEVEDGIVQISGFVADQSQVDLATELLGNVEGMRELRNHLVVLDETPGTEANVDNTALAAKVKAALFDNDVADADEVLVEVRDGVVLLAGFVDSETEREAAYQSAMNTQGVKRVINAIDIASQSS